MFIVGRVDPASRLSEKYLPLAAASCGAGGWRPRRSGCEGTDRDYEDAVGPAVGEPQLVTTGTKEGLP